MRTKLLTLKTYRKYLCFISLFFPIFFHILIADKSLAADYILGPGDVIRISVYDNDDLLTITRISDDGYIIMPLLGQINVQGLNVSQASKRIAQLLADGYIINPQVNIFVQEFRSKKAIILGQVNHPGLIEMSGPTSFLELISQAGGLSAEFGETATVKRRKGGTDEVILIDLKSLIEGGDLSQNIYVQDGDTIYVSKAGMCYVTGEVKSPDAYKCSDNITVLKIIALAGGFTGKAARSNIKVIRMINGKEKIYEKVETDMPVKPDDVIVVPESFF